MSSNNDYEALVGLRVHNYQQKQKYSVIVQQVWFSPKHTSMSNMYGACQEHCQS